MDFKINDTFIYLDVLLSDGDMMKTHVKNLSKEIKTRYEIERTKDKITIHKPAYITVNDYKIRKNKDTCYTIENDYVSVTLWIGITSMHITVFDKFHNEKYKMIMEDE